MTRERSVVPLKKLILLALCMLLFPVAGHPASCDREDETICQIEVELNKSFVKKTDRPIERISVANPSIVDYHLVTPQQVLLIPKQETGTTNMILWYGDDDTEIYDVHVYKPGSSDEIIRQMLHNLVPEARVRLWSIGPAHNRKIVLDGEVESQQILDRVLNLLAAFVPGKESIVNLITLRGFQQVQLEVKIAEISRSGMKQMGLGFLNNRDWTVGVFPSGSFSGTAEASRNTSGGLLSGLTTTSLTDAAGQTTSVTQMVPESMDQITRGLASATTISSPFASAFQVALSSMNDNVLAILSVLKGQNLARILAKPTLVAMSGQEAEFLVGGEFPVPKANNEGGSDIDFKSFGVMLRFTPSVVGKESILLKVEPEVSSPDYSLAVASGGVAVPGLKTRRGTTTLELRDGQSFAMAGLIQENTYTAISKIPFLGDIPYLGTLFTSKEFRKDESELVIIVTPRLVRAMNPDEVPPLPGHDLKNMPDDMDFFIRNRLESANSSGLPSESTAKSAPVFVGGTGFAR